MSDQRNETPDPLAQGQAGEMPEIAAIRAALAAGPTPGIWIGAGPSFGDQFPRYISEIMQDRDDDEECEVTICDFPVASLEPESEANALLISACNPVAIAAVLAHYDAALQAKDVEIARLKAVLRDREAHLFEARKLLDERPAINAGLFEAYSKWTGKVYSLDWLNAVDAAAIRAQTGGEG